MWKLVIEDDEGKRTVVPLSREDYTIGRQEGNTIRLTERNVSRQHGRIRKKRANGNGAASDIFAVEDHQSYNGVFVNGLRVAHAQDLQHGDLIQIGDYRIVLQDDAANAVEAAAIPVTTTEPDAKSTIPMAQAFRGQTLTDRPNRLVMLVGPTPGVEFPLESERMTIGRAEESSISVNHNSVSRLHCEVHALGDGRWEIVDKGSSNGVRVNGVELRRSIIEAGDVIELGDVRFKFVGAGQVFVPGPNESQQLTAISDREAELVDPKRRGMGGYLLPMMAAGVLGAAIIVGFVVMLQRRAAPDPLATGSATPTVDAEEAAVNEAKRACSSPSATADACDPAFQRMNAQLAAQSPWRESADYKLVAAAWADAMLRKAQAEPDPAARRALLQRVASDPSVDQARKKLALDQVSNIAEPPTTPSQLPVATRDAGTNLTSAVVPPEPKAHAPTAMHTSSPSAPTASAAPQPTTPPKSSGQSAFEKARAASLQGNTQEVRNLLEGRVRGGHASLEEARLVKEACKAQGDIGCRNDVNAKYPQLAGAVVPYP
jgi:pSer/pThr/pTyr-binding forkhead associated (FHA) protein